MAETARVGRSRRTDLRIDIRLASAPTLARTGTVGNPGIRGIEGLPGGRCVQPDLRTGGH